MYRIAEVLRTYRSLRQRLQGFALFLQERGLPAMTVFNPPSNRRQAPFDRCLAILLEVLVGPAEMPATDKAAVR